MNQGGTAHWINTLVRGLRHEGINVFLAAGEVGINEREDSTFGELGGIRIAGLGRSISPVSDLKAFLNTRQTVKKLGPEILCTHTAKAGVVGRVAAITLGQKRPYLVHTVHGHLLYGYFSPWKTQLVILMERFLARRTDVIIAAGENVRDELLAKGIGQRDQYVVIRPGVEPLILIEKLAARKSLGIRQDAFVVGWLGRFERIKRPDRVIEIAQALPEVQFLMGGDGSLRERISMAAPPNVQVVGWTTPELIWGASDVALLTSENEAQPISLIEAGLAGLPSVAQNVGSVSEVVEDGSTGYLVRRSEEAISHLREMKSHTEIVRAMGVTAHEHVVRQYSVKSFVMNHMKVYQAGIEN
jgi:glycosyltransferase involved in cell wall biosynthesis